MRRLMITAFVALGLAAGVAAAEPPTTHEIIYTKPSGFWTYNGPAVGGSYRWRLMGVGIVLLGITGIATMRLVKKANAERIARQKG